MSGRYKAFLFLMLFALLVLVFFMGTAPRPYDASAIGMYDSWMSYGPIAYVTDYSIHNGEFPLWNPLILCGLPMAANPPMAMFYPPNLLRSLLTFPPTPYKSYLGLAFLTALHSFFAAVGIFYLARLHRMHFWGAVAAALVFLFSAAFVRHANEHWVIIASIAWLPWLLILERKALDEERLAEKFRYALAAGLLYGISMLPGFVQMTCHMAVVLVAYACIYRLIQRMSGEKRASWRAALGGDLVILVTVHVIAILVAAPMLLPGAEFAELTSRAKDSAVTLEQSRQVNSLAQLVQYAVLYPGAPRWTLDFRLGGAGALIIALLAFVRSLRREAALFGLLFLVMLDCAIGPPLPVSTVLEILVPFQMSFSGRALVACLPLGMLVGLGVTALSKADSGELRGRASALVHLALGTLILVVLGHGVLRPPLLPVSFVAVVFPLCVLLVVVLHRRFSFPRVWPVAVCFLLFMEVLVWNREFMPYLLSRYHWFEYGERVVALKESQTLYQGNVRGTANPPTQRVRQLVPVTNGREDLQLQYVSEVLGSTLMEGRYDREVENYEVGAENARGNLFAKRSFWLTPQHVNGPLPGKDVLFAPTTTVFIETKGDLGVEEVEREDRVGRAVSSRTSLIAAPLATGDHPGEGDEALRVATVGPVEIPPVHGALYVRYRSESDANVKTLFSDVDSSHWEPGLNTMMHPTGDSAGVLEIPLPSLERFTATLSVEVPVEPPPDFLEAYVLLDLADEGNHVRVVERRMNSVTVEVRELEGPRLLLFVDAYYPGWRAYIDGAPTDVLRANGAFKAVVAPAGTHVIRFAFRPMRVWIGLGVSLVTCVLCLGWIVWARRGLSGPLMDRS